MTQPDDMTPEELKELQETCEHEWEFHDDSFSHEFGTETVHYWECSICHKQKDANDPPFTDWDDYDERV